MKQRFRVLCFLIAVFMILSVMPYTALAIDETAEKDIFYNENVISNDGSGGTRCIHIWLVGNSTTKFEGKCYSFCERTTITYALYCRFYPLCTAMDTQVKVETIYHKKVPIPGAPSDCFHCTLCGYVYWQ